MEEIEAIVSFPEVTPREAVEFARRLENVLEENEITLPVKRVKLNPSNQNEADAVLIALKVIGDHTSLTIGVALGHVLFGALCVLAKYTGKKILVYVPALGKVMKINPDGSTHEHEEKAAAK